MRTKKTQNARVLAHLRKGQTITGLQALTLYGCYRLAARIYDLRHQQGFEIDSYLVTKDGARVAKYRMPAQ